MEYVNLGKTGLKVSRICLGCMSYGVPPVGQPLRPGSNAWSLNEEQSAPFFRQALDAGINFFDTANVYSNGDSERVLGRFLKANAKREDTVIATKLNGVMRDGPNGGGLSRKEIFFELDESLRRLETDYVDLYQIHRWDKTTPIEETLEALNDVVRAGKVRYIGASSMWAWQFSKALYTSEKYGWAKFVTMQPHYNLIYREEEREMLKLCVDQGVGVIPWSPLARGKLARPWESETTKRSESDGYAKNLYTKTAEADKLVVERLTKVAGDRGVPMAQVALAWLLTKPAITAPIMGATKLHHLEDAVAAVELKLTAEEVKALEEPYVPHPVLGLS
ncbi:MAG: aldo/keto reductase [Acidobacteriaceae bacterium]|jgi:aryl-alcohol dehydrogenase-like predicted oxidoreductase